MAQTAVSDYKITCCLIYLKSSYHYLVMQMLNCIRQVGTIKMIYIIYMVLKLQVTLQITGCKISVGRVAKEAFIDTPDPYRLIFWWCVQVPHFWSIVLPQPGG
jgi:hypothetical protein